MLALAVLSAAVLMGGFLSTQVGRDAWLDQVETAAEKRGGDNIQQQMQAMEKVAPYVGIGTAAAMLVFIPLLNTVVAGILWGVFNVVLGGTATFKKVFTVVVHASPIGVLGQVFTVPMNYTRGAMTSATNLAVMLPMLEEDSFAAKLAGAIDLFLIWQLFVLAIGLAVLYRRRTQPIATSLFVVYFVIAVIIAAVTSGGTGA
jgi:hypothetical protein